eukprot:RCo043566
MDNPGEDGSDGSFRKDYKPKAGRRRVAENENDGEGQQPATRKGWGDDDGGGGGGGSFQIPPPAPAMTESADVQGANYGEDEDGEPEMSKPTKPAADESAIPELENQEDEDITRDIAEAPRHEVSKVPQLADLEKDTPFVMHTMRDEVDLSLLLSVISPPVTDEEDVEWEPAQLFSQLASELQMERDSATVPEEKHSSSGGAAAGTVATPLAA